MTNNIVRNFEYFKHGNTKESIQVSNYKENLKGEIVFENIHENYVPNVKDHVPSTFVTKYNEVRVVPNTYLHQNSILKKNIFFKHLQAVGFLTCRPPTTYRISDSHDMASDEDVIELTTDRCRIDAISWELEIRRVVGG